MTSRAQLLVLTGPTAVGKTALAINWAQRWRGEIINADSRQLYRHMDIGTGKPTPAEQAAAPHHLLDVVTPDESFTLAQVQAAITTAIEDISGRGKLPILAGGTGMYITAVLEGWRMPEVPPNPELRAELEALSKAELFTRLQALDPAAAATIDRDNPRRLVRAVEVCLISGQRFSDLRRKQPPDYDVLPFALTLEPRETLYSRADARIEAMIAAGWPDEVRLLLARYPPELPAMSALGYPEMVAVLRGEMTLEAARAAICAATHHYIRRQYTWLRGHDPGWRWLASDADREAAINTIEEWREC